MVDLTTACPALSGVTLTNYSVLSVSDDDQTFGAAVGTLSTQDAASYAVIWNRTLGCTTWAAGTGVITHFNGSTGNITDTSNGGTPVKFNIHEAQIFHDGGKLYVEGEYCNTGQTCNAGGSLTGHNGFIRWVWEDGVPYTGVPSPTGLTTWPTGDNSNCGHNMQGYNYAVNKCILNNTGAMQYFQRSANDSSYAAVDPSAPTSTCYQVNSSNVMVCPNDDQHTSWANNVDGTDTAPFFSITYSQFSPTPNSAVVPDVPTYYWDNEILAWPVACYPNCSGNTAYRVAHTYSDPEPTHSAAFADNIAVGSVSSRPAYGQYFVLFTSNWQGQLGCSSGTYSATAMGLGCPGGHTGMRYDTFIATVPIASGNSSPLTVNKSGSGTITSSDGYINCGNTCWYNYNNGTQVSLTATASQGYTFGGWAGCDTVQNNTCTVNMNYARSVSATFAANGNVLTVTTVGQGTVTSGDGYVNCGIACSHSYNSGTQVTLTATASTGYTFSSWGGCDSVQSNTCTVTMNSARTVAATFSASSTHVSLSPTTLAFPATLVGTGNNNPLTLTLTNVGTSSLTVSGAAINGSNPGDFANWGGCGGVTLPSNGYCKIQIVFLPTTTGARTANLAITTNDPQLPVANVPLTGTGTAGLAALSPTTHNFGTVKSGQTSAVFTFTLNNTGTASLSLNTINITGSPLVFTFARTCGSTLAAGASCQINVKFAPHNPGNYTNTLVVNTAAPGNNVQATLTGTGN